MKNLALLCLLLIFSCREEQKTKITSNPNEKTIPLENKKKEEIKYVTAKTGLIFRDKPKGKRLGSFSYGSKLKILKRTGVFQEIKNEGKLLKGEWIEVNTDGTYVFDGFLSEEAPFARPQALPLSSATCARATRLGEGGGAAQSESPPPPPPPLPLPPTPPQPTPPPMTLKPLPQWKRHPPR